MGGRGDPCPALLDKLIGVDLPAFSFLNVNFPKCRPEEVRGVEVTNQGKLTFGLLAEQRRTVVVSPTIGSSSMDVSRI